MRQLLRAITGIAMASAALVAADIDWRAITTGTIMLEDAYLDQPYCVQPTDMDWVCSVTRNDMSEGNRGEHISLLATQDTGVTWQDLGKLDTVSNLTNAYSAMVLTYFGRIYVIFERNSDNVTAFPNGTLIGRDDELGYMYMQYSDDGGATWDPTRIPVPIPVTALDRSNAWGGSVQIWWNVDQVKTRVNASTNVTTAWFAFTKIGTYAQSPPEELWLLHSDNIMTERNASAVVWTMTPDGDTGIQPPNGALTHVGEEAHVVPLMQTDGLAMIFRTDEGILACATSSCPTGCAWNASSACMRGLGGVPVKNPRGPITLKRMASGVYLLLFYFNSDQSFLSRNPYWLAPVVETADGTLFFGEPEVTIYDFVSLVDRPGYPDMFQLSNGSIFITETNKTVARLHRVDDAFSSLLQSQMTINATVADSVALCFTRASQGRAFTSPPVPDMSPDAYMKGVGWTMELWLQNHAASAGTRVILSTRDVLNASAPGVSLLVYPNASIGITLVSVNASGGTVNASLAMDDVCTATLIASSSSDTGAHVMVYLDGGAHFLTMAVNGRVCDGGAVSHYGWRYFSPLMCAASAGYTCEGATQFVLGGSGGQAYTGTIVSGRVYSRVLMHTEGIGNWRAAQQTC